jgi:drug/metabolite transporter (DMT)-like permease
MKTTQKSKKITAFILMVVSLAGFFGAGFLLHWWGNDVQGIESLINMLVAGIILSIGFFAMGYMISWKKGLTWAAYFMLVVVIAYIIGQLIRL